MILLHREVGGHRSRSHKLVCNMCHFHSQNNGTMSLDEGVSELMDEQCFQSGYMPKHGRRTWRRCRLVLSSRWPILSNCLPPATPRPALIIRVTSGTPTETNLKQVWHGSFPFLQKENFFFKLKKRSLLAADDGLHLQIDGF